MMTPEALSDYLKTCDICGVCQLRYTEARTDYKDLEIKFKKLYLQDDSQSDDPASPIKKSKLSACPTCLGLFSPEFRTELVAGVLAAGFDRFECEEIFVSIQTPLLMQIRQLAMWSALRQRFGAVVHSDRPPDVPLKKTIKWLIIPIICEKLGKTYDTQGLEVSVNLRHSLEQEEVAQLAAFNAAAGLAPNSGRGRGKRAKAQTPSRGDFDKNYTPSKIDESLFRRFVTVPPQKSDGTLELDSVVLTGPTVYLAGRYRKITRQLSHTPWVVDGVRRMEGSIEEIIKAHIAPHFCTDANRVIFMSSGREDIDVRCLGSGRPFALEVPNALRGSLSSATARAMELEIEQSQQISVRDLQMVERESLVNIKAGEESKRKYYRALCKLTTPIDVALLEKLNSYGAFELQQKTPLRVLHRRPLHTRPRMIYSLKAFAVRGKPDALILDVVSQAGTYIKELVHGDFGRTTPSIAAIIGRPVDIVALDVTAIELDWPPAVPNATCPEGGAPE